MGAYGSMNYFAMFLNDLKWPDFLPEVQALKAASVPDEDLELEAMLQEVGVEFYELSPEDGLRRGHRKGTGTGEQNIWWDVPLPKDSFLVEIFRWVGHQQPAPPVRSLFLVI